MLHILLEKVRIYSLNRNREITGCPSGNVIAC